MSSRLLTAVDLSAAPSFRRDVEAVHALGARALAELLAEVAMDMEPLRRDWLFDRLAAYRGIPHEALKATGGDRFSEIPLRVVASDER